MIAERTVVSAILVQDVLHDADLRLRNDALLATTFVLPRR